MNPRVPKSVLLPLAAGLVQILSGCLSSTSIDPDRSAGGSDEIDTRIAVDRTGRPVVGARIALVRTDDSTGKPVALSATGKDGSFPSFVVPDGFYSVMLRDVGDSLGKYVDSLQVKNQKAPAGRDTLLSLGSLRGIVRVSAGHSPATVTVGLLGTDILANVKADGTFRIDLVPGGLYTLGAFPSLDGYGPLYKRIQLKDGQNLTLTDTLVLPFTGLPSPGAFRVLQDTGTGNVRVSWNRVDHPDLLGYVLERVESGTVTTSQFLTDTTWTDWLGSYWEAMPLLGPWPSREVAYRVRTRSLSGAPDSKSVALAITANPPEWTKRVDSVKLVAKTDSAMGITTLTWNFPNHPDVKDIQIRRFVDGVEDCKLVGRVSSWSDSVCPDLVRRVIDSASTERGIVRLIDSNPGVQLRFEVTARRTAGSENTLALKGGLPRRTSIVEWRDSGKIGDSTAFLFTDNNWIFFGTPQVFGSTNGPFFSRDGIRWEQDLLQDVDKYYQFSWKYAGLDDSLWAFQFIKTSAFMPGPEKVLIRARVAPGEWGPIRTYRFGILYDMAELATHEGRVYFGVNMGQRRVFLTPSGDSLVETSFKHHADVTGNRVPVNGRSVAVKTSFRRLGLDLEADLIEQHNSTPMTVVITRKGETLSKREFTWSRAVSSYPIGVEEEGSAILFHALDIGTYLGLAVVGKSGNAYFIPSPDGIEKESMESACLFQGELWLLAKNGHLWKGKLNLPKLEKP